MQWLAHLNTLLNACSSSEKNETQHTGDTPSPPPLMHSKTCFNFTSLTRLRGCLTREWMALASLHAAWLQKGCRKVQPIGLFCITADTEYLLVRYAFTDNLQIQHTNDVISYLQIQGIICIQCSDL